MCFRYVLAGESAPTLRRNFLSRTSVRFSPATTPYFATNGLRLLDENGPQASCIRLVSVRVAPPAARMTVKNDDDDDDDGTWRCSLCWSVNRQTPSRL